MCFDEGFSFGGVDFIGGEGAFLDGLVLGRGLMEGRHRGLVLLVWAQGDLGIGQVEGKELKTLLVLFRGVLLGLLQDFLNVRGQRKELF